MTLPGDHSHQSPGGRVDHIPLRGDGEKCGVRDGTADLT